MASGKITITNNTSKNLSFSVTENGQPNQVPVASGTLISNKPSGAVVSGYAAYQVNIFGTSGILYGPVVAADAHVEFIVSSDPTTASDDHPA
jgi:hypothetical protein